MTMIDHPDTAQNQTTDNLWLWRRLERTDPRATKSFKRPGGFAGTDISPQWRMKMATEAFGPCGHGWGWEQIEWTVQEGVFFVCARVWWRHPDTGEVCWTGPQWGGTPLVQSRRDGTSAVSDEAAKMSMTDALGKCLSSIGIGADIYMGQWDDAKYQREVEAYYAAKDRPDLQPAAIEEFEAKIKARLAELTDVKALDELWRRLSDRVKEIALVDPAAQMRIVSYFSQRKAGLQKGGDAKAPAEPAERRPPPGGATTLPRGESPASGQRSPGNRPFALRDEQGKPGGNYSTIDGWLVAANGIACEFHDATEIADFHRHNTAELKRMDAVASGEEQRALAEFRGVLDHALKAALGDDPPGRPRAPKKTTQPLTAEEARAANAKLAAFQDKVPPDDGVPF